MHALLWAADSEPELRAEWAAALPGTELRSGAAWLETNLELPPGRSLPPLVFLRQFLPHAQPVTAESIRGWATVVVDAVAGVLADDQPWALHVEPHYGVRDVGRIGARAWHRATSRDHAVAEPAAPGPDPAAGRNRCRLIREAVVELLQKRRRHLLRQLRREAAPFTERDALVQLLLTTPGTGLLSVTAAPLPFDQRLWLSPFPKGEIEPASDKAAPSRAFAKLVEAELRSGWRIQPGETCVDLGASPGSWTYTAVQRGATVTAVDRSRLREDLMHHERVRFESGDAFRYQPPQTVDWLLCDVIAAPERNAALLLEWLRRKWCRRFVVTLKLKDDPGDQSLAQLKAALPGLASHWRLTRLSANKKEVCAIGEVA